MTKLAVALLIALPALASADPDFIGPPAPPSAVPSSLAASSGARPIDPLDVIAFADDSHVLSATARSQLSAASQWLVRHREHRIVVEGHTDRAGTRGYNDELGLGRAEVVRAYLMSHGVESDRIVVVVYGEADAKRGVDANDRRAVIFASALPVRELVTSSLANRKARLAVWTQHGTIFSETWNAPQISRR
jgi:outer membrane protein OmpA-like peptidoglycan-associated protein